MRKKILIIGVVLLVIGVAIGGTSLYETSKEVKNVSKTMYTGQNGDYYSAILTPSSTGYISVVSSSETYLIPSQDLAVVDSSNVMDYAIAPTITTASATIYSDLNGSYYVVAFGSTTPTVTYTVLELNLGLIGIIAISMIIGFILAIAGIIITIIGAILKPKNLPQQQF